MIHHIHNMGVKIKISGFLSNIAEQHITQKIKCPKCNKKKLKSIKTTTPGKDIRCSKKCKNIIEVKSCSWHNGWLISAKNLAHIAIVGFAGHLEKQKYYLQTEYYTFVKHDKTGKVLNVIHCNIYKLLKHYYENPQTIPLLLMGCHKKIKYQLQIYQKKLKVFTTILNGNKYEPQQCIDIIDI